MHFFSLIGVYCTGLRGLFEPAVGGVEATSFSLPFREVPGETLAVGGRATSETFSFFILTEGVKAGFLIEMDDEDGSGGDGRSFFTGATSSSISSSSTSSTFFLLFGMALGAAFSFSLIDL